MVGDAVRLGPGDECVGQSCLPLFRLGGARRRRQTGRFVTATPVSEHHAPGDGGLSTGAGGGRDRGEGTSPLGAAAAAVGGWRADKSKDRAARPYTGPPRCNIIHGTEPPY